MNTATVKTSPAPLRWTLALPAVLAMAACASAPPAPTAALQAAQQAIAVAERTEAGQYAPGELGEAHTKLVAANAAVADRKMVAGGRLAEQSQAEAELAAAKTTAAKSSAVNRDLSQGNSTLLEELDRKAGDTQ